MDVRLSIDSTEIEYADRSSVVKRWESKAVSAVKGSSTPRMAVRVANRYVDRLLKLIAYGGVTAVEAIGSIALLDVTLFTCFGRVTSDIGTFDRFFVCQFLCRGVSRTLLITGGCAECSALMVCSALSAVKDISLEQIKQIYT